MDIKQLHATPEEDLPRVLGGILQPDVKFCMGDKQEDGSLNCLVCGENIDKGCHHPIAYIHLTNWPEAIKFRDKYVAEFGEEAYFGAISDVLEADEEFKENSDIMWMTWWMIGYGQPVHIYLACAGLELERGKDGS